MNLSYDKNAAVVLLSPISTDRLQNQDLKKWLTQSDITIEDRPKELLQRVTKELGLPYPKQGLGALRMWGQTGDRPTNWVAAADPIYLEPNLDYLCLHALDYKGIPSKQMRTLIDHLQLTLGDDSDFGFTSLASYSYLYSKNMITTASMPAYVLNGQKPNKFLFIGDDTGASRNLVSEIEMALHEHEVNITRLSSGKLPINSLWLWGGGMAPDKITRVQPPLFSDDALLSGYWHSANAEADSWPGSISECLNRSAAGFVAEIPELYDGEDLFEECLFELRVALRSGRLSSLTLLFSNGLRAHVRRSHVLRFWRHKFDMLGGRGQ
ncbi:MAG: hypothetical protein P8J74_04450 [Woeseiaceae bacterium]|nr:hypothetical protein [Woeseiaceae bacterium]